MVTTDTRAITAQAQEIRFWPGLLGLVAVALIGLGKLIYWAVAFAWLSAAWAYVAVRAGYREAKAADQAKRLAARRAE